MTWTFASRGTLLSSRYSLSAQLRGYYNNPILYFYANRTMSTTVTHALTIDNVNPHVKTAQYAVRGELAVRSEKYRHKLSEDSNSLPFSSVVSANIGNPQQLDQKPITFFRQVLSLVENPELLEKEDVLINGLGYKKDVLDRARILLKDVKSVGAYSASQGALGIRQSVAKFIEKRDGHASDPADIYLTSGASGGVNALMTVICSAPNVGVLVPIPQYPLYTATLSLLNGRCVPYYLEESTNWSTDINNIRSSLTQARKDGTDVKAIVIINPGNPTGGILPASQIKEIISVAAEEKLVVVADEVYQTNVFEGSFSSFKNALRELQAEDKTKFSGVELASLHSISKGMVGECGHRGGYMELVGFDSEVTAQLYKLQSISLCPAVIGQCLVELMVNPPAPGEPSHELYKKEYDGIFQGLKDRAYALFEAFQKMEGVTCQRPQGSMYLFPTIDVPAKAKEAAEKDGKKPDEFYVSKMLDATGVCMVAGSGFGQREDTTHFRTTFLAPGTEWVGRITKFHEAFMKEYS